MIILFDGFDGTGKTTLAKEIATRIDASLFATPSDGRLGTVIRAIQDQDALNDYAMAYAYVADQFDVEQRLRQALVASRHVVLDRHCMTSGPAYRPGVWGVLWQNLRVSQAFAKPDLGVVLTADADTVRSRLRLRDGQCPWRDHQIEQISARFPEYASRFCRNHLTLDATLSIEDLVKQVIAAARSAA